MAHGETLTFKTNRTQSGKYWCSAENGLNSTVNASASLDVLCKYFARILYFSYCYHKEFLGHISC